MWFPVFQCAGILTYFSLNFEPSCAFTISIFLLLSFILILIAILYRKYVILCISLIAVLIGFTASKFRTDSVNTHLLDKERYVKNIVATVKDINNKGSYEKFLLYEIKNTKFKLDNIRISVRSKAEEVIKTGDQVKLSAKLLPPKIAPSEYAYDFARIAYYQKISATGFAISKIVLYKKLKQENFKSI